jgi:hypothetical protein
MTTVTITFDELKRHEPELAALEVWIRQTVAPVMNLPFRCGNAWWYGGFTDHPAGEGGFEGKLQTLVGWHRTGRTHPNPEVEKLLLSEAAYGVAFGALLDLMPSCQGCSCI